MARKQITPHTPRQRRSFLSLSKRLAFSIKTLFIIFFCTLTLSTLSGCEKHWQSKEELINSIMDEMIYVPGGTFNFQNSLNAEVTLDSYYMTKYAITEYQYKSYKKLIGLPPNEDYGDKTVKYFNGKYPAWLDLDKARDFCKWLGQQTNLPIKLPTEEQWEYAARSGGKDVIFSTNNGKLEPGKNFPTEKDTHQMNMPVDKYPPNPMGFYMMNANGAELTSSCWADYGYMNGHMHNPKSDIDKCIKENQNIVVRGTMLNDIQQYLDGSKEHIQAIYLYSRMYESPQTAGNFRCVINSSQKPLPKL